MPKSVSPIADGGGSLNATFCRFLASLQVSGVTQVDHTAHWRLEREQMSLAGGRLP